MPNSISNPIFQKFLDCFSTGLQTIRCFIQYLFTGLSNFSIPSFTFPCAYCVQIITIHCITCYIANKINMHTLQNIPESNIPKILPKMLSGVFQNFCLLCSSVFPLYWHYVPRVAKFLTIILEHVYQ